MDVLRSPIDLEVRNVTIRVFGYCIFALPQVGTGFWRVEKPSLFSNNGCLVQRPCLAFPADQRVGCAQIEVFSAQIFPSPSGAMGDPSWSDVTKKQASHAPEGEEVQVERTQLKH